MALTNAFYEAVNSGNVRRLRIMMKDSLLVDPTFREFDEMERAAGSVNGLYDSHDGRELERDKEKWDDNYMDRQMVQIVSNFSRERISHLKEVVSYLRPSKKAVKISSVPEQKHIEHSYAQQKQKDQRDGRYAGEKYAAGAAAGAVAGGVIAAVIEAPVVGGIIAGAVVGGVAASIIVNGGK